MLALRSIKSLSFLLTGTLACLTLTILLFGLPVSAQDQGVPAVREGKTAVSDAQITRISSNNLQADQKTLGSVSGIVVDQTGASIGGARVQLALEDESAGQEVLTDDKGDFSFDHVAPGDFHLTITSEGLAPQDYSATLRPGEAYETPLVMLVVATQVTQVQVRLTQEEIADEQVKEQEKQRVLGFIPNFYVTYHHDAVPLTAGQKFRLAWKSSTDPVTLLAVAGVATVDQFGNRWGAYGDGVGGYARRYGATYGNVVAGTYLGSAILPSLLKQDPRYFYKGTGSKRSRFFYALANSVICKGDNGKWQPNYSSVAGNLAAGEISNLYYPAKDRNGAGTVVGSALVRLAEMSIANVFQEFIIPKFTPNLPTRSASQQ